MLASQRCEESEPVLLGIYNVMVDVFIGLTEVLTGAKQEGTHHKDWLTVLTACFESSEQCSRVSFAEEGSDIKVGRCRRAVVHSLSLLALLNSSRQLELLLHRAGSVVLQVIFFWQRSGSSMTLKYPLQMQQLDATGPAVSDLLNLIIHNSEKLQVCKFSVRLREPP